MCFLPAIAQLSLASPSMATLQRKFAADAAGLYNCTVNTNCDESSMLEYCWSCVYVSLPAPPLLQAPPPPDSGQNHVTPYLVSAVCALGVAFLILTTCGILLRCRWGRRREPTAAAISGEAVFIDEDHGPVDHPIWRIVTVGLPESAIKSITTVKYKKGDGLVEGTDCSVCLTEFDEGDDLRLLPKCIHAFHISCIDTWLRSHQNCPLCRSPVVNHFSGEPVLSGSAPMENPLIRLDEDVEEEEEEEEEEEGGNLRIAEILKNDDNNWRKRAFSDLGENHRVAREDLQSVRRTISLDASASSAMNKAVVVIDVDDGEEKLAEVMEEESRDSGISGLMKSSTIGRSLQKAPVSLKRSFSSSAKILSSFRGSKNQPSSSSSILPL